MDPIAVVKTLWNYKWFALPALLVTLAAALYVFQFGPRTYESTMSYAMVNPNVPSEEELEENPELEKLNTDNPYLRSSDPSLITDVVITRLSASWVQEALDDAGLGTEYTVNRGAGGNGFVIDITGVGATEKESIATTEALGEMLISESRTVQTVNNADETYLFTPLPISSPDSAQEQFSSRLRSVIVVLLGGVVLLFAAVSLGRATSARRQSRAATRDERATAEAEQDTAPARARRKPDSRTTERATTPSPYERDLLIEDDLVRDDTPDRQRV